MHITTKFNIGDTVYYMNVINTPEKDEVSDITAYVSAKGDITIKYSIKQNGYFMFKKELYPSKEHLLAEIAKRIINF